MPRPISRRPRNPPTPEEQRISSQIYVGEVYVNRKQVWKGRGATYEEAERNARAEAAKHPGTRPTVVVRKTK